MGTRSLTYIKSEYNTEDNIVCIYRQFDGYPTGHGIELANFLNGFKVINGIGMNTPKLRANGTVGLDNIIIKCMDVWNDNEVIFEGSPQEFIYKYQEDEVQISY